jgi:Flp pilus assembly protein TadG
LQAPHRPPWPLLRSERGQAIIVVALIFVMLLGFAGLAIDVSSAYALRRYERSAADAAALAGAQDLQVPKTRSVTDVERTSARTHALQSLVSQLKATDAGSCDANLDADVIDCPLPGTRYHVSIQTPSPSCDTCDANHSVQVSISDPTFETTFARLYGQATWNVGITSVAGLTFATKYAIITLQPPKPKNNGSDANIDKDIIVDGNNTVLNVLQGDVGTNTSATTTNKGLITLADGYFIDHYDDLSIVGDTWTKPDGVHPIGKQIDGLITDPPYMIASFSGAPKFSTQKAGETSCKPADFPGDYTTVLAGAVCYKPGIYQKEFDVNTGGGPSVAYLMPGAYSFTKGMKMHGTLGGGLISNAEGVVIVVPQTETIDSNNAVNFLLNAGGETCTSDGCRAEPAIDFANKPVKTTSGLTLTIEVPRDEGCFSGNTPVIVAACSINQNNTVGLAGSGRLVVAGVIYGPSDNMSINGNSGQTGYVGQILAWSVKYTGGSTLDQSYPGGAGLGILRIDAACSGPGTPCNP